MALWNRLTRLTDIVRQIQRDTYGNHSYDQLIDGIWAQTLKKPRDEQPYDTEVLREVKEQILGGEWFHSLDMIEGIARQIQDNGPLGLKIATAFRGALNKDFERLLVGYRFIGDGITPIDSAIDVAAIETGIADSRNLAGARSSLERSVALLSSRTNPDYANSIKESISAVEAVLRDITGESTLGSALKKLEFPESKLHPALRDAWGKLYGWTSNEHGIRHGGAKVAEVDQALAKYMLISCSAFVSFLLQQNTSTSTR